MSNVENHVKFYPPLDLSEMSDEKFLNKVLSVPLNIPSKDDIQKALFGNYKQKRVDSEDEKASKRRDKGEYIKNLQSIFKKYLNDFLVKENSTEREINSFIQSLPRRIFTPNIVLSSINYGSQSDGFSVYLREIQKVASSSRFFSLGLTEHFLKILDHDISLQVNDILLKSSAKVDFSDDGSESAPSASSITAIDSELFDEEILENSDADSKEVKGLNEDLEIKKCSLKLIISLYFVAALLSIFGGYLLGKYDPTS